MSFERGGVFPQEQEYILGTNGHEGLSDVGHGLSTAVEVVVELTMCAGVFARHIRPRDSGRCANAIFGKA